MIRPACTTLTGCDHHLPGWAEAFNPEGWAHDPAVGVHRLELTTLCTHWALLVAACRRGQWTTLRAQLDHAQDHYRRHTVAAPVSWAADMMLCAWVAEGLKHDGRWRDAHDHFMLALTQAVRLLGKRQSIVQTVIPWMAAEIFHVEAMMGQRDRVDRILPGLISHMGLSVVGGLEWSGAHAPRPPSDAEREEVADD